MSLLYDRVQRIATVPIADGTNISVQSIYDQFREEEAQLDNMDLPSCIKAGGKDDLGGGAFTVVTVTLLDGWRIAFEARLGPATEQMTITGGNLVSVDAFEVPTFPIAPTAFTSVTMAQASTGLILGAVAPQELWDYVPTTNVPGSAGEFLFKKILKFAEFIGLRK